MSFKILDEITEVEIIAVGSSIREITRLRKQYGPGRWRKMKGIATIELPNGDTRQAEIHWVYSEWVDAPCWLGRRPARASTRFECTQIHWYEARGIGRKEFKRKRYRDNR